LGGANRALPRTGTHKKVEELVANPCGKYAKLEEESSGQKGGRSEFGSG